jgi:hypothetical protein
MIKRPVENIVIYREQKKDRLISLAASPVSVKASSSSTVKSLDSSTAEAKKRITLE